MNNVVFTVPKKQCTEVEIHGVPFIKVDMGVDADTFILGFLKSYASGDDVVAVVKKEEDE